MSEAERIAALEKRVEALEKRWEYFWRPPGEFIICQATDTIDLATATIAAAADIKAALEPEPYLEAKHD